MPDSYTILLIYFLLGAFAGTMSGLLGIGGGLVVVPGLAFVYQRLGFDPMYIFHLAAGTSLAVMIFTATRSLRSHLEYKIPFLSIYKRLVLGVIIGVFSGATIAHFLHSNVIAIIFGIVVLLISVELFFKHKTNPHRQLPGSVGMNAMGWLIGTKSGLLGIGGGALSVPFLTYCNVNMRQAVVVSVAIGLTIAVLGTGSFIITGQLVHGLPKYSVGYVYIPAWITVALGSVTFAPLGAKLSHHTPVPILRKCFAVFLLIVGIHLLWP